MTRETKAEISELLQRWMDQKPRPARSLSGSLERNGSGRGIIGARRERTMHEMVMRRSHGVEKR